MTDNPIDILRGIYTRTRAEAFTETGTLARLLTRAGERLARAVEQGDIHDAIWELSNVVGQMTTALKLQHRLEDAAADERTWDGIDHNLRADAVADTKGG